MESDWSDYPMRCFIYNCVYLNIAPWLAATLRKKAADHYLDRLISGEEGAKRVSRGRDPSTQVGSQAELHCRAGLGALSGDPGEVFTLWWPDRETWGSQGRGGGGGGGGDTSGTCTNNTCGHTGAPAYKGERWEARGQVSQKDLPRYVCSWHNRLLWNPNFQKRGGNIILQ